MALHNNPESSNPYTGKAATVLSYTMMHPGQLRSTQQLIEACHMAKGHLVLDVGCGIGRTACYLAKNFDCRVMGVDLNEELVEEARRRAYKMGLQNRVEFKVANVQNLPLESNIFDATICEAVLAYVPDREAALREMVRVTMPGRYVGLNETTWISRPPSPAVLAFVEDTMAGAQFLLASEARALMEGAGLDNLTLFPSEKTSMLNEMSAGMQSMGLRETLGTLNKMVHAYVTKPALRGTLKRSLMKPSDMMDYVGYFICAGRKPA
ncbi:MAG: methyltransferase domain-containing protein [Dehalococcoidia bacterium]|nr:methyltransferase domain-containing protein [Dehalococcoidia bacterium]